MEEMTAMLCAGHDGVAVVLDDGHVYLSGEWMAREFPKQREEIQGVLDVIRHRLKKDNLIP
jgi:hypothetical protein